MRLAIAIAGLVALGAATTRPPLAPPGWRHPTPTEASQDWRNHSPHRFLTITADLDGDGRPDTASLLHREHQPGGALVVVLAGSPGSPVFLESLDNLEWLETFGVELVQPGVYLTACGKGYDCMPDEPQTLTLRRPAIDFFAFESANSYFFYDPTKHQFRRVWISD